MSRWALVPVKARAAGKGRLSAVLEERERVALVQTMLEHVLQELGRCGQLDGIAVLSPEPHALPAGSVWINDAGAEMNAAIRAALSALTARGATHAVIVAADLPQLAAHEVSALIAASEGPGIAVAPDRHGGGTNALALALPSDFVPHFGEQSFARHLAESLKLHIAPVIVRLPGLEFDVDVAEDLALLAARHDPRYAWPPRPSTTSDKPR
jgi:2-phospho-L-lactate guanylyltransferase